MPSKPAIDSFTQSWNKTVNWARQQNIPYSAYYPVYQMDSQRLLTGSPLSESERVRAIEAAAGLNYSTALPTDNTSWTNLPQNVTSNAQQIFTGLNPIHLVSNVFDMVKNTIEHPQHVLGALGDLMAGNPGAAGRQVLTGNNVLQLVPGIYDLSEVFASDPNLKGTSGFEQLAKTPLTSILDILPFGRIGSEAVGRTAMGGSIADRLDLAPEELRKMGIWRVGGKLVKTAPVPAFAREYHPFLDPVTDPETGMLTTTGVKNVPTINDLWKYYKAKVGASSEQADVVEEGLKLPAESAPKVKEMVEPALNALGQLTDDQKQEFILNSQKDFRTISDKIADESISLPVRNALAESYNWTNTVENLDMQAGRAIKVAAPFNDVGPDGKVFLNPDKPPVYETYYVDTQQYKNVSTALDEANRAEAARTKAAQPMAGMLYKMDENDRNMSSVFSLVDKIRNTVYAAWQHGQANQNTGLRSMFGLPREVDDATKKLYPSLDVKLSQHQINGIRDLFAPGGLLDQANQAYKNQDWIQLKKVTEAAVRRFDGNAFKDIPKDGEALLYKTKNIVSNLHKYAVDRDKLAQEVNKRMTGYGRDGKRLPKKQYERSVGQLSIAAARANDKWLKAAIHNPPDIWRNVNSELVSEMVAQKEKTAANIEKTAEKLSEQGWSDSELTAIRRDPKTILQIMSTANKSTNENGMLPDVDPQESIEVQNDAYKNLASLRARGEAPLYVHMLTPHQVESLGEKPNYDVYIRGLQPRKSGGSHSAAWGNTATVYDIGLGMLARTKEIVENDMRQTFIDQVLKPNLYHAADVQAILRNYFKSELAEGAEHVLSGAPRTETAITTMERALDKFNLEKWTPSQLFGEGFSNRSLLDAEYYIDKDLSRAFKGTIDRFQFPAQGIVDRGTKLFRFSILGLSPRYTAHILFGGSYMVALRANPSMFRYMGDAISFAMHGSFSDKTYSRFHPDFADQLLKAETDLGGESTEEGLATAQYHYIAMNSAGRNLLLPEWLSNHKLEDSTVNRIKAAASINMRFTRAIRRAQNAAVFLDGAARALKDGKMFYEDKLVPRQPANPEAHPDYQVDEQGRPVYHNVTHRRIHDSVRSQEPMTPQEAHKQGMDAVAEVMGNLRHMTPLERNLLARVFPFYGWTKHVLQYVLSYPFDHPYRAFIVSQLAMQNSQDVASGLPLRIELLTFLGSPDQFGNVTAIDTKALNPFRDTANYASLTGLFESLNPAITGFGALVDPQFSFAGQNLYPTVTFNSLYGIKSAGASGNVFNSAEQFVPQLGALDAAFNLSGQYAYLKSSNPTAFSKKIFESLGLPFTPEQLNLRQIAAKQEIDRYQIAEQAAMSAATNPNSNALAGYPVNAQLPDPLNTLYNVTPAYIAAMNQQSENQYGLPFYETTTPPRTPPGL